MKITSLTVFVPEFRVRTYRVGEDGIKSIYFSSLYGVRDLHVPVIRRDDDTCEVFVNMPYVIDYNDPEGK